MKRFFARLLPYALSFFSSLCIMVLELVASRLVARHVGASLIVWTSVIGIMLGGICLGNVLGGRLADRINPLRAIGPLYALGAALVLGCLWMNSVVDLTPGLESLPWDLRTLVVVTLDFLIPATVLGMISPVVAKIAVEQAKKSGSALGDIYMLGAIGSIVGTFLAGFWLIYLAPTSTIVALVAAALALLAAALLGDWLGAGLGTLAAVCLVAGAAVSGQGVPGVLVGSTRLNAVSLVGHATALILAIRAGVRLARERPPEEIAPETESTGTTEKGTVLPKLSDLAALAFVASLAFMALEMVAGRLVQRHLGSSVFGWTSVIGVLLGGLSLGNYLGGKIADYVKRESQASWLFLIASVLTALILLAESPPGWLVRNPIEHFVQGKEGVPLAGDIGPFLSQAIVMTGYPWWFRVLFWTSIVFFLPSVSMGTVSPVVAKLAVERLRYAKRTGSAIGQVYAWGMVGSILGTFLTGFYLIDLIGTKGLILVLATTLAVAATVLGSVWHAVWAGIPLGLCVIAFVPVPFLENQALAWGIRDEKGDLGIEGYGIAYADESDYYYIKVTNEPEFDLATTDNPEIEGKKRTLVLDNLIHGYFTLEHPEKIEYDYEFLYALVAHRAAEAKAKRIAAEQGGEPPKPEEVPLRTLFLGGGSYTFPRYLHDQYANVETEVAEIDPAVTKANHIALGLPENTPIETTWGDARQFVEKRRDQPEKFDIVFGDAFNDFSVPWHLTTRQFNDMIDDLLTPDGVYMINIIDVYESDTMAEAEASNDGKDSPAELAEARREARRMGGFLGSWVETAKKTFPYVYVFGTSEFPGEGLRETFVVIVSKSKLDLNELGKRPGDPEFIQYGEPYQPKPYSAEHMKALEVRSRGIILTDDYAPVENLLAPVAATRGDD